MKSLPVLCICLAGAWAAATPLRLGNADALNGRSDANEWKVITYDGPRYEMTDADKARLREAHASGTEWEKPAGMPVIEIDPGTILDFGNDTLAKRSGQHLIAAFDSGNCGGNIIAQVKDFGCGTGCISMGSTGWSGEVFQEYHANPYPTMDTWSGPACTGTFQHFGVDNTLSCTNINCCGFKSFIGYYDC